MNKRQFTEIEGIIEYAGKLPKRIKDKKKKVLLVESHAHNHCDMAQEFMHYGALGYTKSYPVEGWNEFIMVATEDLGFESQYEAKVEELSDIMMHMKLGEKREYELFGKIILLEREK